MVRNFSTGRLKIILLLIFVLGLGAFLPSIRPISLALAFRSVEIGKKVPEIRLKTVEGTEFTLSSLRGKKVALLFWWAESEEKEKRSLAVISRLEALHQRLKGEGFEFVSIITDPDAREKVKALKKQYGWTHHVLIDDKREAHGAYGVYIMPTLGILDQEHRLVKALPFTHSLADDAEGEVLVAMGKKTRADLDKERRPDVMAGSEEKSKARTHLNLGKSLFQKGADENAKEQFAKAVQFDPDCGEAYIYLGLIQLKKKEQREALDLFRKGLAIDPSSRKGKIGTSLALEQGNENGKAVKELESLPDNQFDRAEVNYHLGRLYEKEGKKDLALGAYRKALQSIFKAE